ncbi:MAG: hypothetical protein GF421_04870 [Candidatus Aminicenantes bacterium]|nr:hypothetical protein [Candidatus Aminicenantes bacterium]
MNREEIIQKIESIRQSLEQDQFEILTEKIMERRFHFHRSNRNIIMKKLIESLRIRLMNEIELILEPELNKQKEINLRFLKEIKKIKQHLDSENKAAAGHEKKVQ